MDKIICLNDQYSTTRLLNQVLATAENNQKEGGLRKQGYVKQSYPEKPLISIITVVFNGEKHLEQTIKSVIHQSYDNVEYIIIDGGSKDGTLDIIKRYEYAIDYWVSELDEGIYDAMNKGIDLVNGAWVNFMNAGDRLLYLEPIDLLQRKHSYTNYFYAKEFQSVFRKPLTKLYLTRNVPATKVYFIKKEELIKYNISIPVVADFVQMLKLVKKNIVYEKGSSIVFFEMAGVSQVVRCQGKKKYLFLKKRCKYIGKS